MDGRWYALYRADVILSKRAVEIADKNCCQLLDIRFGPSPSFPFVSRSLRRVNLSNFYLLLLYPAMGLGAAYLNCSIAADTRQLYA